MLEYAKLARATQARKLIVGCYVQFLQCLRSRLESSHIYKQPCAIYMCVLVQRGEAKLNMCTIRADNSRRG